MKRKRIKGYWLKRKEIFKNRVGAKNRAGVLRLNQHTSHVIVEKIEKEYQVSYSVAKWYFEEISALGMTI